ncbi:sensor histidine kinase [Conexibacter woesei]|uniref:histidine kinase n=1 Tax=Conexibacter woesei (strain DSM 14684 / CCUG 47730 / CIP 108061 / JCM 11494 / NBRC 100937 / ID131577) TaxID=469383 RepID=D3F7F0_CONWI|nr:ATP-binding protein [Conexibacter woesei]ADB50812.1 integral membrane sensor signal transduction histidine kinase [Conexibacter woesei DSM 14684]
MRRQPRSLALLLGGAIAALGAIEGAILLDQPGAPWVLVLFPLAAWTWFAAGAVASLRRPGNRMGAIMIAGALVWIAAGLANAPLPALAAVGLVVANLPLALVGHLLHAFPSGRLRGAASRAIVAGLYGAALLLHAPSYLFLPDGAGTPLQVADRPDLAQLGQTVQDVVGGGLMIATAVVLAMRLRGATAPQRRVLAPLAIYGIATVVLVPLLGRLSGPLFGGDPIALFAAQAALLMLVPVAFAGAVLRGGFAPTAGVQELSAWLGAEDGERATLRGALADALGDPSVELVLWVGERDGWVDAHGLPATLPDPRSERGVVAVDVERRRVGAIVYDAVLIADAEPVRDSARVIALALDRERLTAELIAGRERLRRSRARIAAAADDERRRIARDLHDGVQGRLVLLALRANELARRDDSSAAARADAAELRRELDGVLAALGELVQGVLPAALVERGLGAAAEDLADRMPVPTVVHAVGDRFPAAVESAGWFVMAEALANAVKHAHARTLEVRVERTAEGVRVEVRDDGVGGAGAGDPTGAGVGDPTGAGVGDPTGAGAGDPTGAGAGDPTGAGAGDPTGAGGTGLRGLADRVDVLGGRLAVESPPGGGTRIVAEVPCGS